MIGFEIADGDAVAATFLEQQLLGSLRGLLPQTVNTSLVLVARNSLDDVVGGLVAGTSYGWLLVKVLWVSEAFQHQGLGRSLMLHAEARARTLGCHAAWLETSNPGAMRFYARLGYEVFASLENAPGQLPDGHCRWFMKKVL